MEKWARMAPNGPGRICSLLIQTLPTFWAERIWISSMYIFLIFCVSIFWMSRSPDSKSPDFQVPRFPDGAGGQTLRSQPDPSPNAPSLRDQMRREEPLLR